MKINHQSSSAPTRIRAWLAAADVSCHGLERNRSTWASLALIWSVAAIIELALQALISRSALRSSDLPLGARFFLFCYSLTVLTFFLFLIGAALKFFLSSLNRLISARIASLRVAGWFQLLLVWLLLIFYAASWGLFWQTGSFIDSQVFIFLAPHPLQVIHWVDRDVAFVIILSASLASLALVHSIPQWTARQTQNFHANVLGIWSRAIGVCLLGTLLGHFYSTWDERQFTRAGIIYTRHKDINSGPLPYIVTDLKKTFIKTGDDLPVDSGIQIQQRPIISLEQYRAMVNQNHFRRWNVVLLIVESLRADQLRAYGGHRNVMPAVESLANDGRVFLNTYTQSSHTNYATIVPLSSHYPLRSATAYSYPENPTYPRVMLYDLLKTLGYHTAIFSSSNENWGGMVNYLDTGNLDRFIHAANSKRPTYVMQSDDGFAAWVRETKHAGSLDDRATVDEAIRWLDAVGKGAFFVALNFQNSHLPYPVPPDFPRRFAPAKLDFKIRFAHFPRDRVPIVKDVYADSLAYVDSQIARLIHYLKINNKWENTVIVLTGDHGQAFYEHDFASHASAIYDEVMKVPLIIRAPGGNGGGLDSRLAQHVDIPPSVAGLLGLPPHPSFQGTDLFTLPSDAKRSVFMVAQTPDAYQYGIVRSGFKLIYDERQRQYLLFDIATDPEEKNDIAAAQPVIMNELAKRLNTWRKLQIDYYSDPALQAREYPPILKD